VPTFQPASLLDTYGISHAGIAAVLPRLTDIPVDITPVFPVAGKKWGET
jgi:hypothetical protein